MEEGDATKLSRSQLVTRVRELEEELASLRLTGDPASIALELRVHQVELEAQNQALNDARRALEEALARYSDLYDFAPIGYVSLDRKGVILDINVTGAWMLGRERDRVKGESLGLWVPESSQEAFFRHLRRVRSSQGKVVDDLEITTTPGGDELRHVRLESAVIGPRAEPAICRTAIVDLSDRKRDEARLSLAAQVFECSADAILLTDRDNHILSVNHAFVEMTGYRAEELLGRDPGMLASGRHDRAYYLEMRDAIEGKGLWSGQIWNRRKNGEIYARWLTIHGVRNGAGEIESCIGIYTQITDEHLAASRIHFLAHYDPLTQLPNRSLLQDRLSRALLHAAREKGSVALLFLDLDRFKDVNDSLGHLVGDRLLQQVADRLKHCVREEDTVSRRCGDEYMVMLPNIAPSESAAHVAEKIIEALGRSFTVDGYQVTVTASIGISLYPEDATDAESMIRNADAAMYRAKAQGRNTYRFFTPDMNAHALERLALESDLHRALERDEFMLMYQPQIDGRTGEVIGLEALLRWKHPQRGLIEPGAFLPIAEDCGLIVPIGEWVLEQACAQVQRWRQAGLREVPVAVNVSALQFRRHTLLDTISRVLERTGIAPEALQLEVRESALTRADASTQEVVRELDRMGVRLAIDDFGTGCSSFSYLRSFPIHKLKIDRSFVHELDATPDARAITAAMIAMAHSLNLRVLAEGVETEGQSAFLQEQHCDEIQGNFFSAPLPAQKVADLLTTH